MLTRAEGLNVVRPVVVEWHRSRRGAASGKEGAAVGSAPTTPKPSTSPYTAPPPRECVHALRRPPLSLGIRGERAHAHTRVARIADHWPTERRSFGGPDVADRVPRGTMYGGWRCISAPPSPSSRAHLLDEEIELRRPGSRVGAEDRGVEGVGLLD